MKIIDGDDDISSYYEKRAADIDSDRPQRLFGMHAWGTWVRERVGLLFSILIELMRVCWWIFCLYSSVAFALLLPRPFLIAVAMVAMRDCNGDGMKIIHDNER